MQNFEIKKKTVPGYLWGGLLFIVLITIDQLVKYLSHNKFLNDRFAFSLPVPTLLMYSIYFVLLAIILWNIIKNHQKFSSLDWVAWILILSGAASNIAERIVLGSVRDFIYITLFQQTGIYNLADGYILVGIILLLLASKDKKTLS